MKIYKVGGAVRDRLLGRPGKDSDWVVVGADPERMLAAGFRTVGRDFPVFLHPKTGEEYALARTERKTGPGYKGFRFQAAPDISLEQDLRRRDLTINAMAETPEGELIDPFGGRADLRQGLLRHVSPAFSEDPLRALRVARFAACLNFRVAEETQRLMRKIGDSGELAALIPERVWREWEKALAERWPARFFRVLERCGALHKLFPSSLAAAAALQALEAATAASAETAVRYAAHLAAASAGAPGGENDGRWEQQTAELARRYRVPNAYRELARMAIRCRCLLRGSEWEAPALLQLLKETDAFRRPERFASLQTALAAQGGASAGKTGKTALRRLEALKKARQAAQAIDVAALSAQGLEGAALGRALDARRLEAVREALSARPGGQPNPAPGM